MSLSIRISTFIKRSTLITASLILAISSLGVAMPLLFSQKVEALGAVVNISNVSELRDAIENQADNQTWNIAAGNYGLAAFNDITAGCPVSCQTGWYFPITADNITINGAGQGLTTIYGTGYTANGNWSNQNFVSIFGDNVTLDNLTIMSKVAANKAIEVIGADSDISNVTVTPNTLSMADYASDPIWGDWYKNWAGSIYYNAPSGSHTLSGVTINNGGVSDHGAILSVSNTTLAYTFNSDFDYRYGFYTADGATVTGAPRFELHLNNAPDNLAYSMDNLEAGDFIELDNNLTVDSQITINKDNVTVEGNNHTIFANFDKTDNSNNSVLSIQADNARVQELTVDGQHHALHGINTYEAAGLTLWRVGVINNGFSGLNINRTQAQVIDVTTAGNGWHGIDVDKPGASLSLWGMNHFNEAHGLPAIYVDDTSVGQVEFHTGDQFVNLDNYFIAGDKAYFPSSEAPATPTNLYRLGTDGHTYTCNAVTPRQAFSPHWTKSVSPYVTHYEYSSFNLNGTPGLVAMNLGDVDHLTNTTWVAPTDGTGYAFWVRAVNDMGLKSDWAKCGITYDSIAPTVSIDSPVNGSLVNHSVTVTGSVNDPNLDHYWLQVKKNGSVVYSHTTYTATSFSGSNLRTLSDDGDYEVTLAARDQANLRSGNAVVNFTIDKTAPVASITSATQVGSDSLVFDGTMSDLHLNYYYCWITLHGDSTEVLVNGLSIRNSACSTTWAGSLTNITGELGGFDITGLASGQYDIHLVGVDKASNVGDYNFVYTTSIDHTAPSDPVAVVTNNNPEQTAKTVTLSTDDSTASIYYTTDGSTPDATSTLYTAPFVITSNVTVKAIAIDTATNESGVSSTVVEVAPVIANEATINPTTTSIVLTWDTTGHLSTSRVIYDTVSHPTINLSNSPNYGYAFSTVEDSTKVTSHTVTVTGLTPGTTYYFRVVSQGSPEAVSDQITSITQTEPTIQVGGASTPTFNIAFNPSTSGNATDGTTSGDQSTSSDSTTGDEAVEGASTEKDVKGAETSNVATDTILGLAWYWWLIIIATLAVVAWWFVAAFRKKKSEE